MIPIPPAIEEQHYLRPFSEIPLNMSSGFNQNASAIISLYYDFAESMDSKSIKVVKLYLSRGISIAAKMYASCDDKFSFYNGSGDILFCECKYEDGQAPIDHAITLVGYGWKNKC